MEERANYALFGCSTHVFRLDPLTRIIIVTSTCYIFVDAPCDDDDDGNNRPGNNVRICVVWGN